MKTLIEQVAGSRLQENKAQGTRVKDQVLNFKITDITQAS
jgi:hypothetical protein